MKDIPKCFGKNSGQSAGMAGPSFWMKRGSKGKKPNYCHAVFLSISKNLSRATGQRASGPFFKKLFSCVHCKKKECTYFGDATRTVKIRTRVWELRGQGQDADCFTRNHEDRKSTRLNSSHG